MPSTTNEERGHRMFWVVHPDTDMPVHADGFECPANDYRWFPTLGYSMPPSSFYEDAASAARKAITDLERRRQEIDDKLIKLREGF